MTEIFLEVLKMKEIFTRVSVRSFEDKPVEREKINQLLKAAFASPSAKNQQPWEFFVVTNREVLQKLGQVQPYAFPAAKAPAAIVIAYKKNGLPVPEKAEIDCAIATENIWLACEELGLGGVMLGIAPDKERMAKTAEAMNLPEDLAAFTIFPFGYPKKKHPQQDRWDDAKIHFVE